MIFRKPYAFIIKNFRKIHIALFLCCVFLIYKTTQLNSFIKEFISYVSYDPYLEPITKYTSFIFYIVAILVIAISIVLLSLFRRKKKPWVLYIIPVFTYVALIITFFSVQKYFTSYEGGTATATARMFRDFLSLIVIPQYITLGILLIRILGIDLNKFSFGNDQEFLELDQDDREEVEVNIEFDKHSITRQYKKTIRYMKYFYEEHRFLSNIVIVILSIFIVFRLGSYILSHKTVTENKILNANGYSIRVNESYITDKDKMGNILEENSKFVVLNLTIKNNANKREMNMQNFHLINGNKDYTYSNSTYSKSFIDIGKEYDLRNFEAGEERTFALIFKVSKDLAKNNFTLYYQQYKNYNNVYLRKLKINLKDVSTITKNPSKKVGEELVVTYPNGKKEDMTYESVDIKDTTTYNIETCDDDFNCSITSEDLNITNKKILEIAFSSSSFEGEELIDFSTNYGKIKYIDSENITRELKIKDATENKEYLGKYLYIEIPSDLEQAKSIEIVYTLRNQQYSYKIR